MRKIAVINQKGGVGKTTSVVNIAAALADIGKRVAVIDLDPQAHLTIHLGIEPENIENGSYEILTQSADFKQSLIPARKNLWLLAANINLVGAESELVSIVGRETILKYAIEKLASSIILCHNHPSGNKKPSESDVKITNKLKEASIILDIKVLDHIIIADNDYYSFSDEGRI